MKSYSRQLEKRIGFIVTDEERAEIIKKHNEYTSYRHAIYEAEQVIQNKYTLGEERRDEKGKTYTHLDLKSESWLAFSAELEAYHNTEEYKDLYAKMQEAVGFIYKKQDEIDKRFSNKFKTKEDLYKEALYLIETFSLDLNQRQQASFTDANSGNYLADPKAYISKHKVSVNFDNVKKSQRWRVCYNFFLDNLDIKNYLAVCESRRWSKKPITDALKAKVDEYYKRPSKSTKPTSEEQYTVEIKTDKAETGFFLQPTSTALSLMGEGLTYAPNSEELEQGINTFDELAKRNNALSNSRTVMGAIEGKFGELVSVSEDKSTQIRVQFTDLTKLVGDNRNAKKMLDFVACKISQQAYVGAENKLIRPIVTFTLQELVDNGIYKNLRTARKGCKHIADALDSIRIKGTVKKGENKEEQYTLVRPFPTINIKNVSTVRLNPDLNWAILISYWTELPAYSFALPNRAYDLNRYIFAQARQNYKTIQKTGGFTISLRAVQKVLNLPNEVGLNNPQRDIKDAIENAIEEIEKKSHSEDYTITLYCNGKPYEDEKISITEYLNKGCLDIRLKGLYANRFKTLAKK